MDAEDFIENRSNMSEERQESSPRTVASIHSLDTNMESDINNGSSDFSSELTVSDAEDDNNERHTLSDMRNKNLSIDDDNNKEEEEEEEEDDDDFYVAPDPNRPIPRKYNPIENLIRDKLLKEWGQYGKRTTFDVSAEFKERHRIKRDRERVNELRKKKQERQRKKAADIQWRKDNFAHKTFLREQKALFDARRKKSKEEAAHRRRINWKRVHDRETVGRVTAEAALARKIKSEKEAEENRQEALRQARERAKSKAIQDAENKKRWEDEQDEFCDNLARKFGVYEGVPRYAPPQSLPELPPKQSTHVQIGWMESEIPVDSDLESEPDNDEGDSGGANGRLTCDLTGYAYAEIITGKNLGQEGAKALADVLTPTRKGGHHQSSEGEADFEPGACEPATKLILRNNNLHLHGTRYITNALVNGALPALQVLDLAGNKIGDTGARYVGQAIADRKSLKQLKTLDLRYNVISDQGAFSLASAFYQGTCRRLEKVVLADNWIGSNGILALVRALSTKPYKKRLQNVSLRRNRLKAKMFKRLRTDHPQWLSL